MEEKEELKYPIKYAIMPIKKLVNLGLHEFEVVVNIVSKCYIVGERTEHLKDGTKEIKYEVVFPYIDDGSKQVIPEYNFYFECINSIFVDQLFDSFGEAFEVSNSINKKIFAQSLSYLPVDENFQKVYQELKEKHDQMLKDYRNIEQIIEEKTEDMIVTKEEMSNLDRILETINRSPIEFYKKVGDSLSLEEKELLIALIKNRNCMNCMNENCKVQQDEKSNDNICPHWDNKELIGKQKILTVLK